MADQQHPITPLPELRRLWAQEAQRISPHDPVEWMQYVSEKAAQWGANTAFEACCEWFQDFYKSESWMLHDLKHLRAACCPKSPSDKEQAFKLLKCYGTSGVQLTADQCNTILRALEALPND